MIYFGGVELRQLYESGYNYFFDIWNVIDMSSLLLNYLFMSMFFTNIFYNVEYFDQNLIYFYGSFAIFFMWIKVFYWFRLFPDYAYYVKLITQTISDSANFSLLVLIIMIAFGNFLMVADINNEGMKDDTGAQITYISNPYYGSKFLDSVISIYMLGALGDFDQGQYTQGYQQYSMIFMFICATFTVMVIFMNMLIAIMTNTFAEVNRD